MRKKGLWLALFFVLLAGLVSGCGNSKKQDSSSDKKKNEFGKVLNIYVWNEEFKGRFEKYYPGYQAIDVLHGRIGEIDVTWNITTKVNGSYMNSLDDMLSKQETKKADEKVDLFLLEADYIKKYANQDLMISTEELGITEDDLKNQYAYTRAMASDEKGRLMGVSWQAEPGLMFYSREAAKEVLGTDVPEKVQKYVKDWDTFKKTADLFREKGYQMVSTVFNTYRVYFNDVSSPWVSKEKKIQIDPQMERWIDDSKTLLDAGEASAESLWSDEWKKGYYPDGKVFAYFGSDWLVDFSMDEQENGSIANSGGWGAVSGPSAFFWGGSWLCAAKDTDNKELIRDIFLKMTCSEDIMKEIAREQGDFVNNNAVMEELAAGSFKNPVLGGQNPLPLYCECAERIQDKYFTIYDTECMERIQSMLWNYFHGNGNKEDALYYFCFSLAEEYSELSNEYTIENK